MKGFCKDCGQMHLVDAKSQKEADTIATDKCECESEAKWFRLMNENVDMLCGPQSRELEFEVMEQPAIDLVKTACEIVRKRKQQNQMTI